MKWVMGSFDVKHTAGPFLKHKCDVKSILSELLL